MSENHISFTQEEIKNILTKLKTLTFNIADCIGILNQYKEVDHRRNIIKDTLSYDLNNLAQIENLFKEKLNDK